MSSDNYQADQVGPIPAEHWKESTVKLEVGTDLLKQSNTQTLGGTEGAQKCWGIALGLGAPEALLPSLAPQGLCLLFHLESIFHISSSSWPSQSTS